MSSVPRRIQFAVNNAAFFVSHRLPVALAARQVGYEVDLVTGQPGSAALEPTACERLIQEGIPHTRTAFRSDGTNLLEELHGLAGVWGAMRAFRPDIVHAVSPKGILYGGLCARAQKVPGLVIAISGMGSLFTGEVRGMRAVLGRSYLAAVRAVYRHPRKRVIVQNVDDYTAVLAAGWAKTEEVVFIPGSGVDLKLYSNGPPRQEEPTLVVLPSRLLRHKGVMEFVEAARMLKARGAQARMVLVGTADYQNPSAISEQEIRQWVAAGWIEWWGHQEDMPAVYRRAAVICLPSYREGMPKVLLEAAAAGRPVVTTNVQGCKEAIIPDQTGLLVPVKDSMALAAAIEHLLKRPELRRKFGAAAMRLAQEKYGVDSVVERTLTIYDSLLAAH